MQNQPFDASAVTDATPRPPPATRAALSAVDYSRQATLALGDDPVQALDLLGVPLANVIAAGPAVVVLDLSAVRELSSLGIGVILAVRRAVTGYGGEVRLLNVRSNVWTLFHRTGIDVLFDVEQSEARSVFPCSLK